MLYPTELRALRLQLIQCTALVAFFATGNCRRKSRAASFKAEICFTPLLLLMIGYDWWSTGKVQRVTIWSAIFMVVQQMRHPLGHTAAWQSFAPWVAMHMPSFP
jgi:hypothetical protein